MGLSWKKHQGQYMHVALIDCLLVLVCLELAARVVAVVLVTSFAFLMSGGVASLSGGAEMVVNADETQEYICLLIA